MPDPKTKRKNNFNKKIHPSTNKGDCKIHFRANKLDKNWETKTCIISLGTGKGKLPGTAFGSLNFECTQTYVVCIC